MTYRIKHITCLTYAAPVADAVFNIRLAPRPSPGQRIVNETLKILPEPGVLNEQLGPYWVRTHQIAFQKPLERLEVVSEFASDVDVAEPQSEGPNLARLQAAALDQRDLSARSVAPYLFASRLAGPSPAICAWAADAFDPDLPILHSARALMAAIHAELRYAPGATDSTTLPDAAFEARSGVCQDFAHIMVVALRGFGVPAAYVSGYLLTSPPPGQQKLVGADAMHAWVNVWCGNDLGWVGFDPTNNCLALNGHIPIGMGRDFADVSPVDGVFIGSAPQRVSSSVDVTLMETA